VVLNEAVAKVAVAAGAVAAKEALDAFIAFIAGAGPPRSASGRSFGRERVRWGEGHGSGTRLMVHGGGVPCRHQRALTRRSTLRQPTARGRGSGTLCTD
jgi:hypothetical protein